MRKQNGHNLGTSPSYEINGRHYNCPFELTISVIVSKWKMKIIKALSETSQIRYGELKRIIPGAITHKMLIQSLRELENDGIIRRRAYPEIPPKVEYSLTSDGLRLNAVIDAMSAFGRKYLVNGKSVVTTSNRLTQAYI